MFFDMILKCNIACAWFIKSCLKPFQNKAYEWNFQINFFDLFSIYFLTTKQTSKFCKVDWTRFLKRLIQLLKLSKMSTYHSWSPHVVQKDNFLRHHPFSNLIVTNLCFFTREYYFLVYFSMLSTSNIVH